MVEKFEESEYWFAVGSFRFRDFKDLYDNVKGRTSGFSKKCAVVKGSEGLFSFPLKYDALKQTFILEWEHQTLSAFKQNPELTKALKSYLPGFKRVGCTAGSGVMRDKFYGHISMIGRG